MTYKYIGQEQIKHIWKRSPKNHSFDVRENEPSGVGWDVVWSILLTTHETWNKKQYDGRRQTSYHNSSPFKYKDEPKRSLNPK